MTTTHPSVSVALAHVMAALPAIGKDSRASQQQGGYAYRGIEAITAHCQPLFALHGIVFVPRVTSWEIRDIVVGGKPWTDTVAAVEYDVYGPAGDHITVGPVLAIGRDNSDKGANKALTQAFKYALLQTLCISDSKDDGDGQTHEADARPEWTTAGLKTHLAVLLDGDTDAAREAWAWAEHEPTNGDEVEALVKAWKERPL